MRRFLQCCYVVIGLWGCLSIPAAFTDSLKNTPVDVVLAGIREVDSREPLSPSQRAALQAATKNGYRALYQERNDRAVQTAIGGAIVAVLSAFTVLALRNPGKTTRAPAMDLPVGSTAEPGAAPLPPSTYR